MKEKPERDADPLRQRAERLLTPSQSAVPYADMQKLIHELEVHQIELELQNEELRKTRSEAETNLERYTELYDFAPVGYVTLGPGGVIHQANLTAAKLLAIERGKLAGQRLGSLVADLPAFNAFLDKVFKNQVRESCEVILSGAGARRIVRIEATLAESGQVCRAMLTDISESRLLQERLDRFVRFSLDQVAQAAYLIGADARIQDVNETASRMLGYSREELLGQPLWNIEPGLQPETWLGHWQEMQTQKTTTYETVHQGKRGQLLPVKINVSHLNYHGQEYNSILARDLTREKEAEAALKRSQGQLRIFVEQAPTSIAMLDRNLDYIAASRRWIEEYGRGHRELIGRNHYEIHPDISDEWKKVHRDALVGAFLKNDDDLWVQADGSKHWLRWAVYPWTNEAGEVGGIIISAEDITERKRAEAALRASEQRLSGLVNSAMDAIVAVDDEQKIVLFNPAAERMFGLPHSDAVGQPLDRLLPPASRQAHTDHIRAFGLTGVTSRSMKSLGILRGLRANGEAFPIEASISQVELPSGKLYTVIVRDITERKQAEESLRASEERYRMLVEQSVDGIFVSDAQGHYMDVNSSGCRMLGYTREEILTMSIPDVITPDEIPRIAPEVARFAGGAVVRSEWQFRRKDGSIFLGEIQGRQLPDGRLQAILRDITERKAAEKALRDSEADLNRAQAVGHIGSWRLDVTRNELTWSVENHRIFEVPEGTPMTYEFFLSTVHPDDRAYVDRKWQAGLRGEPYDIEHRLLVNAKVKWVREKAELELNADGELIGGFGTTQDITDIKQAQLALQEADRRKDEFLALLAHELRNPMAVTATAAFLLQSKGLTDPEICRWATSTITHQTDLLKHLVDDLLDVERVNRGRVALIKTRLDLGHLIDRLAKERAMLFEQRKQTFTYSPPSQPVMVEGDPARLTQVIGNLLDNASKFTQENGQIELSLKPVDNEAVICVRDNGRGIPPNLLPHIFEIFTQGQVSMARDEGGLGIGLALVK
ncbi:MAG: PAS domain S-box protein, partial [Thiobacillaceae bacterium]